VQTEESGEEGRKRKEGGREGKREGLYLGDKGAVAAVDHEDVGALPLGYLLSRGRGAHFGGVGIVKLLGDETAGTRGKGGDEGNGEVFAAATSRRHPAILKPLPPSLPLPRPAPVVSTHPYTGIPKSASLWL